MNLAELLAALDRFDDRDAIYATPKWAAESHAVALAEPGDGSVPTSTHGMTYLTTVGQAKRAMTTRRQWRPDLMLTAQHACDAVIYFARYDEDDTHQKELDEPFRGAALKQSTAEHAEQTADAEKKAEYPVGRGCLAAMERERCVNTDPGN